MVILASAIFTGRTLRMKKLNKEESLAKMKDIQKELDILNHSMLYTNCSTDKCELLVVEGKLLNLIQRLEEELDSLN